MSGSDQKGLDKILGIAIAFIIIAFAFLYMKKSGQLDTIRDAWQSVKGGGSSRE